MITVGVVYPQTELGGSPSAIRDIAIATEQMGYSHLLAYDHVLGAESGREPALAGPYTERDPFHDPLVLFAHVAAITNRIELVTGVLVLPQRQTALVARQAADVDLLSAGRLRLGVGVGWNPVEYEALGVEFTRRGARIEEQVKLLRALWSEPSVDFQGDFHRVDRAGTNPRPLHRIPIWMGGFGMRAHRRAASLADGFIFAPRSDAIDQLTSVRRRLEEQHRDPQTFGAELLVSGAPARAAETIQQWFAAGGTHAAVVTMLNGFESVTDHVDHLERVRALIGSSKDLSG